MLLQDKIVSSETNICYPYKALIDVLLHYGFDLKEGELQSELYYKDSGNMDAVPPGNNPGLMERVKYTQNSTEVTLEGPVYTDMFQQDRLIINGVKIVTKFHPISKKFSLMTGDNHEYKVQAQTEALSTSPALYPYWKSNFKTISIPSGITTVTSYDIFHGSVPSKLIVAMVKTSAFQGDYKLNPFNFINADVTSINISVDGQTVPSQPLRPDFSTGDYTTSFLSMFFNNYPHHGGGNWISGTEYANGYSFFCFDIQGEASEDIFGKIRKGFTKLEMSFGTPTSNLMILLYSLFPGQIKIDKARNVIL